MSGIRIALHWPKRQGPVHVFGHGARPWAAFVLRPWSFLWRNITTLRFPPDPNMWRGSDGVHLGRHHKEGVGPALQSHVRNVFLHRALQHLEFPLRWAMGITLAHLGYQVFLHGLESVDLSVQGVGECLLLRRVRGHQLHNLLAHLVKHIVLLLLHFNRRHASATWFNCRKAQSSSNTVCN